jgi:hypothetical protein
MKEGPVRRTATKLLEVGVRFAPRDVRDWGQAMLSELRLANAGQSARLADEAVRLDPNLLWTYAVVAVRHPELPQIQQWLPRLERCDPQNALFQFISAESIDIQHVASASKLPVKDWKKGRETDPAWRNAMAAAFLSPKLDDYLDRLEQLDQRVERRYGFEDPQELFAGEQADLPSYTFWDTERYGKSLLRLGESLEARGNRKEASDSFWAVAHFGQVMDSQAHTSYEHWLGAGLQAMAYKHLQVLSGREGKPREAALFAYLGRKFDPVTGERQREREWVFGSYISRRNAAVLQISSLMMLMFSGLLVIAASVLIAGRRRGHGWRTSSPRMTVLALISAVGVLLSSATLYLTYRPYWYIFQGVMLKGETSQTEDLRSFLWATRMFPGELSLRLPVYFWTGVILAGIAGLILILLRHVRPPPRLNQAQPHPRAH